METGKASGGASALEKNNLLRAIPKVDELLRCDKTIEAIQTFGRAPVLEALGEVLDETREALMRLPEREGIASEAGALTELDRLAAAAALRAALKNRMRLQRVINGTGTVLHTNLGRAPLSRDIKEAVWEIAENHSTLEYNIETGKRGSRYDPVCDLLTKMTGAEAALIVNNNAAAVLLALSALAKGADVVVSRGELVEIGESFRLPAILEQSGARLREVGTTNKTRLSDYQEALDAGGAGALLKVNTSNYKIVGFTEEASLRELKELGEAYDIPLIHDLGSGALIDLAPFGIAGEMTASESVSAGADIVCFSGDKLLGGPQAGIVVGKRELIATMKRHPLTRALRIDKLTLAALEATLRLYLNPETAVRRIPTLAMLTVSLETLRARAGRLCDLLNAREGRWTVSVADGFSRAGGGTLPLLELPTAVVTIKPGEGSPQEMEKSLRCGRPPIIARIQKDCVLLDVRTIREEDVEAVADGAVCAFERLQQG